MAESTIGTYLGYDSSSNASSATTVPTSFALACDITDYPDLDSPAERIETTTLSDKGRTYTKGLKDTAELTFTANFDKAKYTALEEIADTVRYWAVLFEESKSLFYFKGKASVAVLGAGVGDVRTMSVTIYPEQAPDLAETEYYYNASSATITTTNPA
jgi:hypothetical protein